jgi:hypothetical protein
MIERLGDLAPIEAEIPARPPRAAPGSEFSIGEGR